LSNYMRPPRERKPMRSHQPPDHPWNYG
jgi:hypothetical protein